MSEKINRPKEKRIKDNQTSLRLKKEEKLVLLAEDCSQDT